MAAPAFRPPHDPLPKTAHSSPLGHPQAQFCLHTEGNGWGARVVDYMAMECLPLIINDSMMFSYANVLDWHNGAEW